MKILTKSKNLNVVQLTDAELAALLTPSVKIETVDRDDAYDKNFADMSGEDFYHTLQFHYHAATCGKIDPDKFKIIFRDIFSYLAAHNINLAQFADNNINLDSKSAFDLAHSVLHAHCDAFLMSTDDDVAFTGEVCILITMLGDLLNQISIKSGADPVKNAEVIFKFFKEVNK